jgi:PTH2 family peptidyl-tRNA hydrolase
MGVIMDKIKQVIVVRSDLKMPKGKLAAQVAHASLATILKNKSMDEDNLIIPLTPDLYGWITETFFKVVLKVNSEQELLVVALKAKLKNLPVARIVDAGHTFFDEPTLTCIGIGPAKSSIIDEVTGDLKLL